MWKMDYEEICGKYVKNMKEYVKICRIMKEI